MKLITSIFLILAIFSCNSKYDGYNEFDDMNNIFSGEFERDIFHLKKKNNKLWALIVQDTSISENAIKFQTLITDYTQYIERIESKLMDATENPFFSNDTISQFGTDYLTKNNSFREKLLMLIEDESFKKYVANKLKENNPMNRNGERTLHINYYFKDIRKSGTLAYLKYKRKNVLEIENENLTNLNLSE